jgi:hypothetical protein
MNKHIITSLPFDIEEKLDFLTNNIQEMGISHVGHGIIFKNKTPTAYFSSKDWGRRYDADGLVHCDPIRACAIETNYQILPWDAISCTKEQKINLDERKRAFCAHSGVLISLKNENFHETLVLGCDSKRYSILNLVGKNIKDIISIVLKYRSIHMNYYVM